MKAPLPPLDSIPPTIVAVADYMPHAQERMTASAWAYLDGAAADELTRQDNQAAYQRLKLQARVLRDLTGGNTRVELFGLMLDHPVMLAPVAYHQLAHSAGESATALGAAAMKAAMVLSTQAGTLLEDIAALEYAPPLWFQLYVQQDRQHTQELISRAERAGYRALVLTVDAPVNGVRNTEQRSGFSLPPDISAVNLTARRQLPSATAKAGESVVFGGSLLQGAATWDDVAWLRSLTDLPILLKGILHPADALKALELGMDGIIVSNHGGRTLDTLPATIDALPAIAKAVAGRVPILLDGGIRRGTDILKALALGAKAVLIGRPYIYGLAAAGAPGVAHVLHILRSELEVAMALTGCRTLADIGPEVLWRP
jgi:4-hydroxymandelate oxidase